MASFIESRSIDYVPLAERHGKVWHLWPVWFAGDAHLATVAVGVLGIALGGNFLWTAIAVVLGSAARHLLHGVPFDAGTAARAAADDPVATAVRLYGGAPGLGRGAWCPTLATTRSTRCSRGRPSISCARRSPATSAGEPHRFALLALSARRGRLRPDPPGTARLRVPDDRHPHGILLRGTLPGASAARHSGTRGGFRGVPFLAQLFAAASYQLSWSIYVSDYSRYLPRDVGVSESFWWTYLGAFIGGAWMMLVGTVAAAAAPQLDVAAAMEHAADQIYPGLRQGAAGRRAARPRSPSSTLNFYGASLTLLSVADTVQPLKRTGQQAPGEPCAGPPREHRDRVRRLGQLRQRFRTTCRCCCICSRPGPRSTSWTSTWCAKATTRSARSSTPEACTGAGTGAASSPTWWASWHDPVLQHRPLARAGGARARQGGHRHADRAARVRRSFTCSPTARSICPPRCAGRRGGRGSRTGRRGSGDRRFPRRRRAMPKIVDHASAAR